MKLKSLLVISVAITLMLFSDACINNKKVADSEKDINANSPENNVTVSKVDYAVYDSVDAMYDKADLVIRGKALDSRVEWMSHVIKLTAEEKSNPEINPGGKADDEKILTTIYTLEISDVYKGSAGKTIEVLQSGGKTGTAEYIYEETPEIALNKEYIMFLSESALYENSAWLLNNTQALYRVEGNNLIKLPGNTLELTFEDLVRLGESSNTIDTGSHEVTDEQILEQDNIEVEEVSVVVKSTEKLINAIKEAKSPDSTNDVYIRNKLQDIEYFYEPAVEFPGYELLHIEVNEYYIFYRYMPEKIIHDTDSPAFDYNNGIEVTIARADYMQKNVEWNNPLQPIIDQTGIEPNKDNVIYDREQNTITWAVDGHTWIDMRFPESFTIKYEDMVGYCNKVNKIEVK